MQFLSIAATLALVLPAQATIPLYGPNLPPPILANEAAFLANLSDTFDQYADTSRAAGQEVFMNATSFAFTLFDANDVLLKFYHTANDSSTLAPESVKTIDENTVFRIGSASKLVAVYTFLAKLGWKELNRPITDFVPEFAKQAEACSSKEDPIDCFDWDDISLGALASQMAGITRDFEPIDATVGNGQQKPWKDEARQLGLINSTLSPELQECGVDRGSCSPDLFAHGFSLQHPVTSPFSQPIYSNAAFQFLIDGLQKLTNESFPSLAQSVIFDKLNMKESFTSLPPNSTKAIIPMDVDSSGWKNNFTQGGPEGGLYSSSSDFTKLGQSILSHKLLSKTSTNRWYHTVAPTASYRALVGMPWEITRYSPLKDKSQTVDVYAKGGDVGMYHVGVYLAPQYGVGWTLMLAGPHNPRVFIESAFTEPMLAAIDKLAHSQAKKKLAGTFCQTGGGNGTMTIKVDDAVPGLNITSLTVNGADYIDSLYEIIGQGADALAYPMDLSRQTTNGTNVRSWRIMNSDKAETDEQGLEGQLKLYGTWEEPSYVTYSGIGPEELLIETDAMGRAVRIEVRAANATFVPT